MLTAFIAPNHHKIPSRQQDVDPVIIGIVTLEDVFEHALQTELVDEHDVFMDSKHGKLTSRMKRVDWSMLQLFDHRQKVLTSLPPQELQAVYHFLGQSVKAFIKHQQVHRVVDQNRPSERRPAEPAAQAPVRHWAAATRTRRWTTTGCC